MPEQNISSPKFATEIPDGMTTAEFNRLYSTEHQTQQGLRNKLNPMATAQHRQKDVREWPLSLGKLAIGASAFFILGGVYYDDVAASLARTAQTSTPAPVIIQSGAAEGNSQAPR